MLRAVGNHVDNKSLARFGRENIGTSAQVFLNNVVLCSPSERGGRDSLLFSIRYVKTEQPSCGGVYGHGSVHLLQRNLIEQGLHLA